MIFVGVGFTCRPSRRSANNWYRDEGVCLNARRHAHDLRRMRAVPRRARLCRSRRGNALSGGMRIPLNGGIDELRLGRGVTADLRPLGDGKKASLEIPDPRAGGTHARLVREEGGWLIEDTNSTHLRQRRRGQRTSQALLEEPTVITLGATCLIFGSPRSRCRDTIKTVVVDSTSLKSRPLARPRSYRDGSRARCLAWCASRCRSSPCSLLGDQRHRKRGARTDDPTVRAQRAFRRHHQLRALATLVESQLFGHLKGARSQAR